MAKIIKQVLIKDYRPIKYKCGPFKKFLETKLPDLDSLLISWKSFGLFLRNITQAFGGDQTTQLFRVAITLITN